MQKAVVSQNVTNPFNSIAVSSAKQEFSIRPFFICSSTNFLVSKCVQPADLFHSLPKPHFKSSKALFLIFRLSESLSMSLLHIAYVTHLNYAYETGTNCLLISATKNHSVNNNVCFHSDCTLKSRWKISINKLSR